jgi:hypothetical protein
MDNITVIFVVGAMLLVVGGLFVIVVTSIVQQRRLKAALRTRGKTVQGTIVVREWKRESRFDAESNRVTEDVYTIRYEYVVDGSTYRHTLNASSKQFVEVAENETVEVVYLPEKPTQSMLAKFI